MFHEAMLRRMIGCTTVVLLLFGCGKAPPGRIAEYLKDKPAAAFVFLATDCPLSQSYTLTLNTLRTQFRPNGIEFYGVFPGRTAVDDFASTYKLSFPVLPDPELRLADFFEAAVTPEVFVVTADGRTVYSGAIDNGAPQLGERRTVVTEHYLLDALNSIIQNTDIRHKRTEAVGCFIERNS